MGDYFTLFIGAVLINNFVLTRFLGLCIFFGVSKSLDASLGMGVAVTAIMVVSSVMTWLVYTFALVPFGLKFLQTPVFVLLIACSVQLLEMIIKKHSPALYNMWGIYLMLIAANCIVFGLPVINAAEGYGFVMSVVNSFGSGAGFALAIVLMASLREKLQYANVPKTLDGLGISFILAGMLALAFLGFSGMIS
ncbi:electron transport complex protein RnfA [Sporomusa termitida]|uniref:Ion-translocating oxidoreductase complex subunit A n=1 Tax=Sporomusa termitida TaxID=2377 RepID=A0A517DRX8_9FIRM|nr:Rnf-Nqr domain containing protein [Sporomusa termitida]QDR80114.1 Electron transport complex subunit RsxA [Sporomusa termitida]